MNRPTFPGRIAPMFLAALACTAGFSLAQQKPAVDAGAVAVTAPGRAGAVAEATITARVEAIDAANRIVTLKGPAGNVLELPVGPEVRNFAQIKVGDFVAARYVEALTLELKKGGAGVRERTETVVTDRTKPGEKPGVAGGRQIKVIADVVAVNAAKQTVTLRGPKRTVDLNVRDPEQLKLIKVGDQVEATYTEAVAVSVDPATPPPAKK